MARVAVIGGGYIAREHLACLNSLDGVEVVGICDVSPVMAEATAEQFGVAEWHTDHRKLLDELNPDAVHVTTPPQSHSLLAGDALCSGAHVFVEKPITIETEDLIRLKGLAKYKGRMLVEDHNYQFNGFVQHILALIDSGDFGEVVHVEVSIALDITGKGSRFADPNLTHPALSLAGGAIGDFLTHLSYLSYIFVGEHRKVRTVWQKRGATALPSDEFRALIEAERGTASLVFSSHSQPNTFRLRVHGSRMRATTSMYEPLLTIERSQGAPRPLMSVLNGRAVAKAHRRAAWGGLWRKLSGRPMTYEGLWEVLARFYRAVDGDAPSPVPMRQIESVHALVKALTSEENKM